MTAAAEEAAAGLTLDIEIEAIDGDPRFAVLGDLAGYNEYEAWGRLLKLWSWCLKRQVFAHSEVLIRRYLGPDGVRAILADGDDKLALGERMEDGQIYIRGSWRLKWLGEKRKSSSRGGGARAATATRESTGRFASSVRSTTTAPALDQRSPAADQLPSSTVQPLPLPSPDPLPEEDDPKPRGRARPVVCEPIAPAPSLTSISSDWKPSNNSPENDTAHAIARGKKIDLADVLRKFRDDARRRGLHYADWDAAWRLWLAKEWAPAASTTAQARAPTPIASRPNPDVAASKQRLAERDRDDVLAERDRDEVRAIARAALDNRLPTKPAETAPSTNHREEQAG